MPSRFIRYTPTHSNGDKKLTTRCSYKQLLKRPSLLVAAAFLSVLGAIAPHSAAAQTDARFDPQAAIERLSQIERSLNTDDLKQEQLMGLRDNTDAIGQDAVACIANLQPEIKRLQEQKKIFENIGPDADAALFDQLIGIRNQELQVTAKQASCLTTSERARVVLSSITNKISELAAQYMWQRASTLPTLLSGAPSVVRQWPAQLRGGVAEQIDDSIRPLQLLWLLLSIGVVSIVAGIVLRLRFNRWFDIATARVSPGLTHLLPRPIATYAPLLLLGTGLTLGLFGAIQNASIELPAVRISLAILIFGIGCAIIDWATGPLSPAAELEGFYPDHVQPLRRRLRVFVLSLVGSFVLLGRNWLGIAAAADGEPLIRVSAIATVLVTLWIVLQYAGGIQGISRFNLVRRLGILAVLVALGALVTGYQNFASYLAHGLVRTISAIVVVWILLWLVFSVFESLIEGKTPSARKVREFIGVSENDTRTGFGLLQLVADVIIWVGLAGFLLYVWDSSGNTLDDLANFAVFGTSIGDIALVPSAIASGLLVFGGLIAVTGWMKRLIDKRWLRHMSMDRGARDALVTLFGYIGFIIAMLIGLAVAKIDLGGLAIVGGALALGIGFGLQAIASNFVSGLILLFERPIKAGDFVTVGDIEGFVRRIRIRATDIETLDNQNVLVPNSELISGRVTNWVLRNPQGRLRIPVGVAYGSDVQLVRELVEKIACEHEEVISDGRAPAPRALFMGFGDSSLDFELRVRVRRIERRYTVISDINFKIDAAFREHNISIPFPQRDLHVISMPNEQSASKAEKVPAKPAKKIASRSSGDDMTRYFRHQVRLKCSIERAWTALTDQEELQRWYGRTVEIQPRIGGRMKATLHDDREVDTVIDVFMPPRRLRFAQQTPDGERPLPTGPVTEELTLQKSDDDLLLTVKVSGIPADEDWEGYFRRAESHWETSLAELKKLLGVSSP